MLRIKYEEKAKMGEWAEKKECYNAAVSLYYYNIFLRLKCYLKSKNKKVDVLDKSSHLNLIETFEKVIWENKKMKLEEIKAINSIKTLSRKRKDADYSDEFIFNNQNYEKEFKKYYTNLDEFLKKRGI